LYYFAGYKIPVIENLGATLVSTFFTVENDSLAITIVGLF
jgi:hypothetical protein